jgi:hypothetical protein
MADDRAVEVYRLLRSATDKYCYFLLAAAGACIAFAVNQTNDTALSWSQLPLGAAVLSWAMSVYFGCRSAMAGLAYLRGNFSHLTEMQLRGRQGMPPAEFPKSIEDNAGRAENCARWQFVLLLVGAAFFICWHVFEMYLRAVDIGFESPTAGI